MLLVILFALAVLYSLMVEKFDKHVGHSSFLTSRVDDAVRGNSSYNADSHSTLQSAYSL